jgi:hypothetical protein
LVASTPAFVAVELEKLIVRRQAEGPALQLTDGPHGRTRSGAAAFRRVRCVRRREVITITAAVEQQPTLERLLGTVSEAMTREVVLLAADMSAELGLRRAWTSMPSREP